MYACATNSIGWSGWRRFDLGQARRQFRHDPPPFLIAQPRPAGNLSQGAAATQA